MEKEYCKCSDTTRMGILYANEKRYCTRCSKELEDVEYETVEDVGEGSCEGIGWPEADKSELLRKHWGCIT